MVATIIRIFTYYNKNFFYRLWIKIDNINLLLIVESYYAYMRGIEKNRFLTYISWINMFFFFLLYFLDTYTCVCIYIYVFRRVFKHTIIILLLLTFYREHIYIYVVIKITIILYSLNITAKTKFPAQKKKKERTNWFRIIILSYSLNSAYNAYASMTMHAVCDDPTYQLFI